MYNSQILLKQKHKVKLNLLLSGLLKKTIEYNISSNTLMLIIIHLKSSLKYFKINAPAKTMKIIYDLTAFYFVFLVGQCT